MKCIIPAAGKGTRLQPHTQNKPKALLKIGNKPIITHILDKILEANITDFIIVVGYEKEKLIDYLLGYYSDRCNFTFVEQEERRGLGHAIYMAGKHLEGESTLITLGDALYENSYLSMITEFRKHENWDGVITVREVSNPQSYGVVVTEANSQIITQLVEKPKTPVSNKAITGVYLIRNTKILQKYLSDIVDTNATGAGGEIQLTDALQMMVEGNYTLGIIESGAWYDCGNKEALLEGNHYVLSLLQESEIKCEIKDSIIVHPVAVETGCVISKSIIGPNVSIAQDTTVTKGIISSSVIGSNSSIVNVNIENSLIGDEVSISGRMNDVNLGDGTKIQLSSGMGTNDT